MRQAKLDKNNYMFTNFEVESYSTDETSSNNPSTISRVRNLITRAFCILNKLPKLIVIILEDALVKAVKLEDYGVTDAYKDILAWLVREYKRSILDIKDKIPPKANKAEWPHILFLAPTVHTNYTNDVFRRKFTSALESTIRESRHAQNMSTQRITRPWDSENNNFTWQFNKQMSDEGLKNFWLSVDKAVKYTLEDMQAKLEKKSQVRHFEKPTYFSSNQRTHFDHKWYNQNQNRPPRNDRFHFTRKKDKTF